MGARPSRGIDRKRLRRVLGLTPDRVLRAAARMDGEEAGYATDLLLERACSLLLSGHTSLAVALAGAPEGWPAGACRQLGLQTEGTRHELLLRIGAWVEFEPLGDASRVPLAVHQLLPGGLRPRERLLALELHAATDGSSISVRELVARLGRRAAVSGNAAVEDLATFLDEVVLSTRPSLRLPAGQFLQLDDEVVVQPQQAARAAVTRRTGAYPTLRRPSDTQLVADVAALGMAVARADDIVDPREEALVHMHGRLRALSPLASEFLERLRTEVIPVEEIATRVATRLSSERKRHLMQHLTDVALADGVIVSAERRLLERLAELLGQPLPSALTANESQEMAAVTSPGSTALGNAPAAATPPASPQAAHGTPTHASAQQMAAESDSGPESAAEVAPDADVEEIMRLLFDAPAPRSQR